LEKTCAHVQKEKHLIKLLLTFQHGKTFYLLFEWADGNLQEFWDLNSSIQITKATELWAAQQCLGLAKAISRIHGLSSWHDQERKRKRKRSNSIESQKEDAAEWGRHGDIKPANILWFEDYGDCRKHLVISDLGLARYHTEFSKSLVPRALLDGITWGYRAPEIDFGSPISPKYDIFSLGCVFLEFCIWYLRGSEEVAIFGLQRDDEDEPELDDVRKDQFFSITSGCNSITGACLKQCVQEVRSPSKMDCHHHVDEVTATCPNEDRNKLHKRASQCD
jgi:serine/threonine protein kinase